MPKIMGFIGWPVNLINKKVYSISTPSNEDNFYFLVFAKRGKGMIKKEKDR